ncbi:ceramide-1-phosphate transfer protein isoform X2 [Procambarus clarkii]|nr:ceramide-1-phosphate transfer protein-like [Procambarus clarkii]
MAAGSDEIERACEVSPGCELEPEIEIEPACEVGPGYEALPVSEVGPDVSTGEAGLVVDLALLKKGFSPTPEGQLLLDGYLDAYTEMNKFFQIMGPLFQVVSTDVQSKVRLLREYCSGEAVVHYHTLHSMIDYETKHNLLTSKAKPSGARTLLRLHRALEFVTEFLVVLVDPTEEGSFGRKVSELYGRTLAKYHGLLIRKTFSGILLLIPKRQTIINRLANGNSEAEKEAMAEMPRVIQTMKDAYNFTQKLYQDNDLLDLP